MFCSLPVLAYATPPGDDWRRALGKRDLAVVERLLPQGVNVNLAAEDGKTALMLAASQARTDLIGALLTAGADVNSTNSRDGTALMYGATSGDVGTMEMLLLHGAAVNARASNGWTALMIASAKGYVDIVKLLLAAGAQPNLGDIYGWTPLLRATHENRRLVVLVLLQNQATDVNAKDDLGETALHHAAAKGYREIARALIVHGADSARRDSAGRTPSMVASAAGHLDLAEFIRKTATK